MPGPFLGMLSESYDVLLVGNGSPPARKIFTLLRSRCSMVVALDGGVNTLKKLGEIPDAVIGDLDSARPAALQWARRSGAGIVRRPSTDLPDIAKGIIWCRDQQLRRVLIAGVTGERVDHLLSTLGAVTTARSLEIAVVTNEVCALLLLGRVSKSYAIPRCHTVSWFGLPAARSCTMTGVRWPFRNRKLALGGFHSLSNLPVAPEVNLRQQAGVSILIVSLFPQTP